MEPAAVDAEFEALLRTVKAYQPRMDEALLRKAYAFAEESHRGQVRKSGEPYILHPVQVAGLTAELRLDHYSLCAALLHDTVEDTDTTVEDIQRIFSDEVAVLVDGLTKLSKLSFRTREEAQAENLRKLIVATSRDIRVVLIKLCDRLHNIRTLHHMKPEGQQRIARETMDIFAPLANRLGISWIKGELEDTAFRYLEPDAYYALARHIATTRKERDAYVEDTTALIKGLLVSEGVVAEVQGRSKHFYSIWKKMQKSGKSVEEIHDLTAFRIIVDDHDKFRCYHVLGMVHDSWKCVASRFKDYIAVPKSNGYRSIHTTVIGPGGTGIEIQIRTKGMHEIAEYGVAAHWAYKEGRASLPAEESSFTWLRQLAETQSEISDHREYLDSLRLDLYADEVFVFTPNGDIKNLPKGSTPLDFAYAIHSEVGDHCVHAKVNGTVVPLRTTLRSGDRVEVITRSDQFPREEWLEFVASSKARQKIARYLTAERRERSRELGRTLLMSELRKAGLKFEQVSKSGKLEEVAAQLKVQTVDKLLIGLGNGSVSKEAVLQKLRPADAPAPPPPATKSGPIRAMGERLRRMIGWDADTTVTVEGVDADVLLEFARCCSPVPPEEIVGFVTRGRGITVHASNCSRLEHLEQERIVPLGWSSKSKPKDERGRPVTVRVICRDEPGALGQMSAAFSSRGVNIRQAHCRGREDGLATNLFDLEVLNAGQLEKALEQVRKIDAVVEVVRVRA